MSFQALDVSSELTDLTVSPFCFPKSLMLWILRLADYAGAMASQDLEVPSFQDI